MKRLVLLLMAIMLAVPAAVAEESAGTHEPSTRVDSVVEGGYHAPVTPSPMPTAEPLPLPEDPLLRHAVEIAQRIDLLAKNEKFVKCYLDETVHEKAAVLTKGAHARPARVYHLSGQVLIDALYAGTTGVERLDFTRPELQRDLMDELPEILWGRREQTELAVLNLFARCKIFALTGAKGCGLFFFLYDDAVPVLVTWKAENACVETAAYFMPDEALNGVQHPNALSEWFAGKGMPFVQFEEVPLT